MADCLDPNETDIPHYLLPSLRNHLITGRTEKLLRTRGSGGLQINSVFWVPQGICMYELTAAMSTCTKVSQTKSQHGWGKWEHKVLPLAEALLTKIK